MRVLIIEDDSTVACLSCFSDSGECLWYNDFAERLFTWFVGYLIKPFREDKLLTMLNLIRA